MFILLTFRSNSPCFIIKIKSSKHEVLDFLQSCDFYGIVPKLLHFKLANPRLRSSAMNETCRRRLLSTALAQKKRNLKRSQEKIKTSQEHLRSIFSWFGYNHLICFVATFNIKSLKRVEIVQNRKLENLKREYLASVIDFDKVIFNYSTYILNDVEKKEPSRGLKFSIRRDKLDYCNFPTPFEKQAISLKNRPIVKEGVHFNYVKTRLKSIALAAYYGYDSAQFPLNISKAELSALKK